MSSGACLAAGEGLTRDGVYDNSSRLRGTNITGCLGDDSIPTEGEEAVAMRLVPKRISSIPLEWKVKQVRGGHE